MTTANNVLRTYASKPFVTIERNTGDVLGSAHNCALASAIGASKVGDGGFRVIDLSAVGDFEVASINACDISGAMVAQYARGLTVADISAWLKDSKNAGYLCGETVADRLRKILGKLSRVAAGRQVAQWILDGATG